MKSCKCKFPEMEHIGNNVRCKKCGGWVLKVRKSFHKPTQIKKSKKHYKRNRDKTIKKEDLDV